jgi:hypothetical protein
MRQSEFDKLSAALDRAEFAMEEKKSWMNCKQAGLGKNAGRDFGFELGCGRTFAAATKNQRCGSHRQSTLISGWSPIQNKDRSWTDGNRRREGAC